MPSSKPELEGGLAAEIRVSVVMCTYNGTRFLEMQLQSLLRQTLRPFELVVCDDASTDSTLRLLEDFAEQAPFPVQLLVNETNLGSTRNFDRALQRASGEFLALCDQDDIWLPEKLATLALVLQQNPHAGGVFSDAQLLQEDAPDPAPGARKTLWELHGFNRRRQERFTHGGAVDLLLKHDVVTGATLMVRRDLRPFWTPIPPYWVHDSWIAWMLAVHSTLVLVPRPLIQYRIHAQQQLGVGGDTRLERIRRARQTERARYARVARQFQELQNRIAEDAAPANPALSREIGRKIALLQRRSQLPHNLLGRILYILADTPSYWRYARGWRSLRKDLFLS